MGKPLSLHEAVSRFGVEARKKLKNVAVHGAPEDQLRTPLERLIEDIAALCGIASGGVTLVGETSIADLKTRPDYAVTRAGALLGFIEVKAPGKGADPRKFKGHDREQWEKIQALPNLLYTDGNSFSLWRSGELEGAILHLTGDVETSGAELDAPASLQVLFESFFQWQPIPPKTARQLAEMSARLCRLLRDEVAEQLALKNDALIGLARDWRALLFPDATDGQFADGYAQAVTFGLLVARAYDIPFDKGIDHAAKALGKASSLIGTALRVLTDNAENHAGLKTSVTTLTRVLGAVDWKKISKGNPDAWLYFYEDFLGVYDNNLRKQTGSYYTPPDVVEFMVRVVDDVLRGRFELAEGLASPSVKVVDPAVGTGTFLLGVFKQIAASVAADQGEGAVGEAVAAAVSRLFAFEMQLGPFAVAQLRVLAAIADFTGGTSVVTPRMYVTDTLGDPHVEERQLGQILQPIAASRREANKIKREEKITVVLGNPPYKEKARGRGHWVENGSANGKDPAPLAAWFPPAKWGVSAHTKHLRNLYVYFWRWATWKVFDQDPQHNAGVVCFITVAGFLNGPGFQRMRAYLRETADEIWVIDCSPEGHQPEVATRIFEGVQQPVCIVLAHRAPRGDEAPKGNDAPTPARVLFRALPSGHRKEKFAALRKIALDEGWQRCSDDWRAPFLPEAQGAWATFPTLDELFVYNGSGVMPGRTWVIAPDKESLERRWQKLIGTADDVEKAALFHPHLVKGKPRDRHVNKEITRGFPGHTFRSTSVANDDAPCIPPTRYAFRSFDRQWIVPDQRLINQPNPELWCAHSGRQVYLTAPSDRSPSKGPALTATDLIPDLHHYNGRGGRAFPLWLDHTSARSNIRPNLLSVLSKQYGCVVVGEDVMAYVVAVLASPAYTARFLNDLKQPGLRVPITADAGCFHDAVELGRRILWLHTFGERYVDASAGRPPKAPRMPEATRPTIPAAGAIKTATNELPDNMEYDGATQRLLVGGGYVEHVPPAVWNYEVSGKDVLRQWFSYRRKDRERPVMGDRRPPSPLGDLQPDHWIAEYTKDLLDVLNVLGLLIALEPEQQALLERVCAGPLISRQSLQDAGAFDLPASYPTKPSDIPDPREAGARGTTGTLPGVDATS